METEYRGYTIEFIEARHSTFYVIAKNGEWFGYADRVDDCKIIIDRMLDRG